MTGKRGVAVDLRLHPCWILPDGTQIDCPNWDHCREASRVFKHGEPEWEAMKAGWLKVYERGYECGRKLTPSQRELLDRFGCDPDDIQAEAAGTFNLDRRLQVIDGGDATP